MAAAEEEEEEERDSLGEGYEGDTCPAQTYGGRNACMYMRRREKEIISRDDVNKQMATFANRL